MNVSTSDLIIVCIFCINLQSQVKPDDLSELQNRVQQTIDKHLPVHRELISLEEAMAIPNIVSLVDEVREIW